MKVSVIIPCYNVENTIERCLESVINQTYPVYEIICVEDHSTDGTLEILQKYQGIRLIIHNENMGLGITRGDGIKAANGDYIYCIDSDDWIEPDAIAYLVENADGGDIVTGGEECEPLCSFEAVRHYLKSKTTFMNNRLIKRTLFDIVPHSTMRYLEDLDTLPRLFANCEKAVFVPECKYNYNKENPDSLNATASEIKRFIHLELCHLHNYMYFVEHHPDWIVPLEYPLKILSGLMFIYQEGITHPDEFNRFDKQTDEIQRLITTRLLQVQCEKEQEGKEDN